MNDSAVRRAALLAVGLLLCGASAHGLAAGSDRVARILARQSLVCGIWPQVPGFAVKHGGAYSGFEVDICRAIAAGIFGDATKARFVALERIDQFAVRDDVDLVLRRLTWTLGREAGSGYVFGPVTYFDGQGFLVPRASHVGGAVELAGKTVCVLASEHFPGTLQRYFQRLGRSVALEIVADDAAAEAELRAGHCQAYSADISLLAAARAGFAGGPEAFEILADQISAEPTAPLMRVEDVELLRLVRWTVYAMLAAEELGIDSHDVRTGGPGSPDRQSFLAIHPGGEVVPRPGDWLRAIVEGVGNYGEVFERNLGQASAIRLDRRFNRLWTQGGLLFAPPFGP